MKRCPFILAPLFGLITTLLAGQNNSPKHLADAKELLHNVKPQNTSYRHKDTVVKWAGPASECHTDCSGLLDSLIHHSYPKFNDAAFKKWFGVKRPLAHHYYDTIAAQKGFTRISRIGDARPGDFIAIKYPPGGANTGHTMLVSGNPKPHNISAPLVDGTTQWEIPIIDCSTSGHGKTDTRRKSDGAFHGGLGSGVFRIYTHKSGALAGYSWSVLSGSEYHDSKSRPIVIGRLDPKFEP
jgi:hypothetical protein